MLALGMFGFFVRIRFINYPRCWILANTTDERFREARSA